MEGQIPTNLEDLPALDNVLVRLLFLFGLSETEVLLRPLPSTDQQPKFKADNDSPVSAHGPKAPKRKAQKNGVVKAKKIKIAPESDDDDGYGPDPSYDPYEDIPLKVKVEEGVTAKVEPGVGAKKVKEKKPRKPRKSAGANNSKSEGGENKTWHCQFCQDKPEFTKRKLLIEHQERDHQGYHEQCKDCKMMFYNKRDLREHTRRSHSKKELDRGEPLKIHLPPEVEKYMELCTSD